MEPIITKTMTDDGWEVRIDYGKQGVSVGRVHIAPCSHEEAMHNRQALDRVLLSFGYVLDSIA